MKIESLKFMGKLIAFKEFVSALRNLEKTIFLVKFCGPVCTTFLNRERSEADGFGPISRVPKSLNNSNCSEITKGKRKPHPATYSHFTFHNRLLQNGTIDLICSS